MPSLESRRLLRMVVEEPVVERQAHDLQVEPDRPVFDVVQVVLDPVLERGGAAPGGLATIEDVRSAILSGAIKDPAGPW